MTQTERDLKSELDALDTAYGEQSPASTATWPEDGMSQVTSDAVKSLGVEDAIAAETQAAENEKKRQAEQSLVDNAREAVRLDAEAEQAKETKDRGVFGDSWGVLAPEERAAAAQSEYEFSKSIAERTGKAAEFFNEPPQSVVDAVLKYNPMGLLQGAITRGFDASQQKRFKAASDVMEGRAPLPELTPERAFVENTVRGAANAFVVDSIQAFGIARGYATKLSGGKYLEQADNLKVDPSDDPLYKIGLNVEEWVKKKFPGDGARQQQFAQQLAQGVGSTVGFAGSGWLGKVAGLGERGVLALIGLTGAASSSSQTFKEVTAALKKGDATEFDRTVNMLVAIALGATEAAPFAPTIGAGMRGVGSRAASAIEQTVEESLQEGIQQTGSNLVKQQTYDPNQTLLEGVPEGMAIGGLTGGVFGGALGERANVAAQGGGDRPVQEARVRTAPDAAASAPSAPSDTRPVAPMMDGPAQSGAPSVKSEPQVFSEPELEAARKAIQDAAQGLPVETAPQAQPGEEAAPEPAPEAAAMPETEQQAAPEQPSAPPTDEELDLPAVFADIEQYLTENEIPTDLLDEDVRKIAQAVYQGEDLGVAVDRALGLETAPAAEEAPSPEQAAPAGPTPDVRQKFAEVLASKTPRSQWAEAAGIEEATLNTLIDEAVADGRMEIRFGKPVRKAAARVTPVKPERPAAPPSAPAMLRSEEKRLESVKSSKAYTATADLFNARGTPQSFQAALERIYSDKSVKNADLVQVTKAFTGKRTKPKNRQAAIDILSQAHKAWTARNNKGKASNAADSADMGQGPRPVSEGSLPEAVRPNAEGRDTGGTPQSDGAGRAGDVGGLQGGNDDGAGPAGGVRGPGEEARADTGDRAGAGQQGPDTRAAVESEPAAEPVKPREPTPEEIAALQADLKAEQEEIEAQRRDRMARNYRITDADRIGQGGPKQKVRANIAAIETLKKIEEESRPATDEEKAILVKYVGWGAFSQAIFAEYNQEFAKERNTLKALMTPEEYASARASTINAHFTSPEVIKGMWAALRHLGFKGGRVLEPSVGVGHFIGLQPADMAGNSAWTAVDLDTLSGRITKALYGAADVRIGGYEEQVWPNDHFDLAISNVPFAAEGPYDPNYKQKFTLHDYFFVKSLDKVRPGGIVAFITSSGTLDKTRDQARREMEKRGTFLGAIRLPGGNKGAFKANAGTDVTTDIIFFRKRMQGEPADTNSEWTSLETVKTPEGNTDINGYFVKNPDMMLGKMRLIGSMYGKGEPVLIGATDDMENRIADAAKTLPESAMTERSTVVAEIEEVDTATDGIKEGAFYEKDGKIYRKVVGVGVPQKLNKQDAGRVRAFIPIRDTINEMLAKQASGDKMGMADLREALSASYDAFVKEFGPINLTNVTTQNRKDGKVRTIKRMPNFAVIEDDTDAYKVAAIESYDVKTGKATKTAIFTEDLLKPYERPVVTGPADALTVSLNEAGRVDMKLIANILGVSEKRAALELGDAVYLNPTGEKWQTATQYLSGDVVTKLEDAKAAAELDPKYQRNVVALEAVQPVPLTRNEITVPFGASYVPEDVLNAFLDETLGARGVQVNLNPATKSWTVRFAGGLSDAARAQWATPDNKVGEIVEAALNSKPIMVWRTVDKETRVRDPKAEELARAKVTMLKEAFTGQIYPGAQAAVGGWIWNDEARAVRMEAIYNLAMNRLVKEQHDGSHLTFPGLARVVSFPDGTTGKINLPPARTGAIWRIIQNGNTLIDHVVGAGKAQPLDAKVLTPTGWVRMGNIRVGDKVVSVDGKPTTVVGVFPQGEKEIYRVTFSDGSSTECCDEHLWFTQTYRERTYGARSVRAGKDWECGNGKVRTLSEIRTSLVSQHLGAKNHSIPMVSTVCFEPQRVPLDPYVVGALIGDGCLTHRETLLSSADQYILERIGASLPENCEIRHRSAHDYAIIYTGRVAKQVVGGGNAVSHPVRLALEEVGLWGKYAYEKRIPQIYKHNSVEVRLGVLRGLMDTDGTISNRGTHVSFSTSSSGLADDVAEIVQSLGGVALRSRKKIADARDAHILTINMPPQHNPFALPRKAERVIAKSKYAPVRYIVGVDLVGKKPAQCIAVDNPSHLYVTDDYIVTHNTWTSIMAVMEMKRLGQIRRPMFVVPNHMLMQFSNEFLQAYPGAKLLVATKDNMSRAKRAEFAAKASAEKWDGIIITHSAFSRLKMQDAAYKDYYEEILSQLESAKKGEDDATVKDIEKAKKRIKTKLDNLIKKESKDQGITFEEMGVDHLTVDECFPHSTPVITDRGVLPIGEIVENRLPVKVLSRSEDGMLEWKSVVRWLPKKLEHSFVKVTHERGHVICTGNHKIWTESGYARADALVCGQVLRAMRGGVSVPQRRREEKCETAVLLQPMRSEMADVSTRPGGEVVIENARLHARKVGCELSVSREDVARLVSAHAGAEPHALRECCREDAQVSFWQDVSGARWQRAVDAATDDFGVVSERADGVRDSYHTGRGDLSFLAPMLQGGRSLAGVDAGDRSGWSVAQFQEMEISGCEEDCGAERSRVVSVEVLKPGHPDFPAECLGENPVVYDIEVADNHNYFANGTLVSNCHLFKNLWFMTRHTRVKGISNSSESQRATDLYIKIRHLEKSRPGRSALFLTGTPLSNTMAEVYTMMRYLQRPTLEEYDIAEFDSWAQTFGLIDTKTELASNSKDYTDVTSFSKFVNIPELSALYGRIADTQTAESLGLERPAIKGGMPQVIMSEPSEQERSLLDAIIKKMEELKGKKPEKGDPNFLSMFTKGLQASTDARLVDPMAEFNPDGKIGKAVANIYSIWERGNQDPAAPNKAQIVFLDMGVPGSRASAKPMALSIDGADENTIDTDPLEAVRKGLADTGTEEDADDSEEMQPEQNEDDAAVEKMLAGKFNLYEDIKNRLVEKGMPADQIAFIHDAKNDDQKAKLFEAVREGKVRVLIGSTGKMGVGTNVQKRLIALHHIDAPWRPSDLEQRDGRILRQGNKNPEIEIYRYITTKSFEAYRWQILERKASFIAQFRAGARGLRIAEDIDSPLPDASEIKAAATGDSRIIEYAELERTVRGLIAQASAHSGVAVRARQALGQVKTHVATISKRIGILERDAAKVTDLKGDAFKVTVNLPGDKTQDVSERKKAGQALGRYIMTLAQNSYYGREIDIEFGTISGFGIAGTVKKGPDGIEVRPEITGEDTYRARSSFFLTEETNPVTMIQHYERLVGGVRELLAEAQSSLAAEQAQIPGLEAKTVGTPFPKQAELEEKQKRLAELAEALKPKDKSASPGMPSKGEVVRVADMPAADWTKLKADIKMAQPYSTVDQLLEMAAAAHGKLTEIGKRIAKALGITFKEAPLKSQKRIVEKLAGRDPRNITDAARGGFEVQTVRQSDQIIEELARELGVVDEGWFVTESGYFDRKVMVRFDNGLAGEIQVWPPGMLEAKNNGGHDLYVQARKPGLPEEERERLNEQQRQLYAAVIKDMAMDFQDLAASKDSAAAMSKSGNFAASPARDMGGASRSGAESRGSADPLSTLPVRGSTNTAESPAATAGAPSQLKYPNVMAGSSNQDIGGNGENVQSNAQSAASVSVADFAKSVADLKTKLSQEKPRSPLIQNDVTDLEEVVLSIREFLPAISEPVEGNRLPKVQEATQTFVAGLADVVKAARQQGAVDTTNATYEDLDVFTDALDELGEIVSEKLQEGYEVDDELSDYESGLIDAVDEIESDYDTIASDAASEIDLLNSIMEGIVDRLPEEDETDAESTALSLDRKTIIDELPQWGEGENLIDAARREVAAMKQLWEPLLDRANEVWGVDTDGMTDAELKAYADEVSNISENMTSLKWHADFMVKQMAEKGRPGIESAMAVVRDQILKPTLDELDRLEGSMRARRDAEVVRMNTQFDEEGQPVAPASSLAGDAEPTFTEAALPNDSGAEARTLEVPSRLRPHVRSLFAAGLDRTALEQAIGNLGNDRGLIAKDWVSIAEAYSGTAVDGKSAAAALRSIRKAFAGRVHDLSLAELGGFDPAVSGSNLDWRDEVKAKIETMANRLPEGVDVAIRDAITIAVGKATLSSRHGLSIEGGMFSPAQAARHLNADTKSAKKILAISLAYGPDVAMQTFTHEEIHALRGFGLFTDKEWSTLSKLATRKPRKNEALRLIGLVEASNKVSSATAQELRSRAGDVTYREIYDIDERYSRLNIDEEKLIEEVVAHAAADWADGHDFGTRIERLMMKIRDFIEALGNFLRGNGFESVDSIFRSVWSGEVAKRSAAADDSGMGPPIEGYPVVASQRIDAASFSGLHASNKSFKRFDDARVGSGVDAGRQDKTGLYGPGHYITLSPEKADLYKEHFGPNGLVYQVDITRNPDEFLNWHMPLAQQGALGDKVAEAIAARGFMTKDAALRIRRGEEVLLALGSGSAKHYKAAGAEALKSLGIAGIAYTDTIDNNKSRHWDFVVFNGDDIRITHVNGDATPETLDAYGAMFSIAAWHGTPHKVDRFDREKMGTGEGAQAFGKGLYFAENKAIAEWYKERLAAREAFRRGSYDHPVKLDYLNWSPKEHALDYLYKAFVKFGRDQHKEAALQEAEKWARHYEETRDTLWNRLFKSDELENAKYWAKKHRDAAALIRSGKAVLPQEILNREGNLYKVEINADPDHFYDLNKSPSEQSFYVKRVLREYIKKNSDLGDRVYRAFNANGENVVINENRDFKYLGTQEEATKAAGVGGLADVDWSLIGSVKGKEKELEDAGIAGFSYFDASSRAQRDGTRNYVVFDDGKIRIVEENGAPVTADDAMFSLAGNAGGNSNRVKAWHSTPAKFDKFDNRFTDEVGFHFGSKNQAHDRAYIMSGGNLWKYFRNWRDIPVEMDIKNPVRISEDPGSFMPTSLAKQLVKDKIAPFEIIAQVQDAQLGPLGSPERAKEIVRNFLISKGYDAIVYPNQYEGIGDSYMTFGTGNVRHAVTGDVLYSLAGDGDGATATLNQAIDSLKSALGIQVTQNLFGVTIKAGKRSVRINPRSNILGQTSRATGGVGVRRSRDIRAIAHEGGHSLELMLGTSLDSIKAKFADSLVAPFAPDSPMPKLAPAGYSGLELDDVEQRALIDAVKANEELLRLSAVVGNAKSAPRLIGKPKYDEEAYRKAETKAGVARAQLIRLIGKPRADALMDEVRNKAPVDATQFVAERFSPMGAPKRRKTATPDGEALSEGFARWFEKYVMAREAAFDMASDFFEAFEDLLEAEAPSVLEGLHTVQSQYKDWTKRATVEEMSSDMVSVASQNDWNALAEGRRTIKDTISGWAAGSYTGIIDDLSPVQQIVRRLLAVADRNGVKDDQGRPISLKVAENPYKIARMFRGSYATGYSWIQDGIPNHGEEKVVFPGLQRALETVFGGARWDEATYKAFGQYLTSKRAIAEYDRLANKKKRLADIESILKQGANVWRNLRNEQDKDNEKLDRRNARLTRLTAIRDDRTKALRRAKADEKDIQKRMQGLRDDLAEAMRAIDDGSDVAKTVRDRKRRSLQVAERNARDARNMVVDLEQELQDIDMEWTFLGNEVVNLRRAVESRQPQIDAVVTSINLLKKEREATAKRGASRPPTLESREWHEEYIGKVESNKKYAKFAEAAQSVYAFTQGLLTVRYQAGLISEELYRELSSRKGWYVPFMRDMTDAAPEAVFSGNGGGKAWSPFKKFDGSDRAIINPLEILSQEAYAAAQHIAMNEAVGALAALAQKAGPGSAQIAELMERTEDIENTPDTWNRIRDIAISMGIDEADATLMAQRMEMNFANEDLQAIWSPSVKGPIAKPSLPLWDKGTRKHVVLHDPEFGNDALQAMMGMGKEQMNWLLELVGKPARVLQVGVTTHPTFMPRNLVRDVFDAWIKTGALPIITQVRGARALVEKDGEFLRQYTAAGGILGGRNIAALTSKEQQADVLEMDPNKIRHGSAALGAMALGITGTIMGGPLGGLAGSIIGYAGARHGGLLKMVEAVESMTRLGVAAHAYQRALKHNPNLTQAEAMLEAAFVARDVFDWNRRGSKSLALVRTITFLNAQIQGLDKAARAVGGAGDRGSAVAKRLLTVYRREHDVPLSADEQRDLAEAYKVFGRLALYTAFLLGLYAMYRDDDRYEDIKSATKATHSWMPGFLGVDVRLPKAFEWAMPANFVEALWDKMSGRDPDFGARMSKSVQEVMVPPGVPQGLNLLVGWTTNTDMQSIAPWMFGESADKVNRKIVSDELKKLAPEAQFDAFTSQLSKDIAIAMAKAGLPEEAIPSPKMIDFTMRTGGYWGTDIQKAYQYTKESLGLPAGPQPRVPDMPLIGGFTGIAARQSKSLEEVYKLMSQQGGDFTTAAATYKNMMDKAGDPAGAEAFLNRLEPEARAYAILAYNFPASDKRRHPLERASAMAKITRDIRKEIVLERLAPTKKEGRKSVYDFENRIDLPPPVKTQVTDIMERLAQAESWNGFVALGRPGWEGKQEMATKPIMEELKAAAPDVYALFMDRVDKAKIEDYETIKKEWPKMRDELLRNGADANF